MGLAHAGRAEEHHILPVFQEAHGSQLIDLALVDGGLEREIEVVQGFLNGKARHLDLLLIRKSALPLPTGLIFYTAKVSR